MNFRGKPGSAARELLGGDDSVHVFASQSDALDYGMRVPGALTLAPNPKRKGKGWDQLVVECREIPPRKLCLDRVVHIELERDADERLKTLIRSLGVLLYRAGALEVRVWGRLVQRPGVQQQLWRSE